MISILDIQKKYSRKIDSLDLELILSHAIQKPQEFVLAHPEKEINVTQVSKINKLMERRLKHEPMAYILGEKEFYGLNFKVTKDTLIPRPETEHLVDAVISNLQLATSKNKKTTIIDIGTGSGNIIISLAKNIPSYKLRVTSYEFFGIDISKKALHIARYNAKKNKISKQIKFIKSNLLNYFLQAKSYKLKADKLIIVANLPYVSEKIYSTVSPDIKNFEPKSALLSDLNGLSHYEKLFQQLHKLEIGNWKLEIFLEFSPEQKSQLQKLIKKYFPKNKIDFFKDLAGKWRVASFTI
jgi:release factor glutamine methyltransferase